MHNRFTDHWAVAPTPGTADPMPLGTMPRVLPNIWRAPELCQLADRYKTSRHPRSPVVQVKANGWRCIWLGGDLNLLVTREGEPLPAAARCITALRNLERLYGEPMMFDGEIAHEDGLSATQSRCQTGLSTPDLTLWLFDAVPLLAWQGDAGARAALRGANIRVRTLEAAMSMCAHPHVGMLRGRVMDAPRTAIAAQAVWIAGHEGLIVKDGDGLYERRRSSAWQKIKQAARA